MNLSRGVAIFLPSCQNDIATSLLGRVPVGLPAPEFGFSQIFDAKQPYFGFVSSKKSENENEKQQEQQLPSPRLNAFVTLYYIVSFQRQYSFSILFQFIRTIR
jgi:hypothetical protein